MRWWLSLASVALMGLQAAEETRDAPTAEQLAAWVKALGHEEYAVREEAQAHLASAGSTAASALQDAVDNSGDAEVRERAARLLKCMNARPRIEAAVKKLGADTWDELGPALNTLCAELGQGTGAEAALNEVAAGNDAAAQMAKRVKEQWEAIARQKEQFRQSITPENAVFLQQYLKSLNENLKLSVQSVCRNELERRQKKPRVVKVQQPPAPNPDPSGAVPQK
jgi:hypothetical protein